MATTKNKRKAGTGKGSGSVRGELSGPAPVSWNKDQVMDALKEGGLILLSAIAGSGAGAAVGKHSLLAGLPVTLYGIYKKNNYLTSAGLGLALSNGFQFKKAAQTTEGIGALDMQQMASEAKERVTTFFKNFGDKLYLPKPKEGATANGLGENEEVTYFLNPYSQDEPDMSELDRLQEQVAQMNGGEPEEMEFQREF